MEANPSRSIAAIIVAAGRGLRAGGDIPKQWQSLAGRRVIDWTLDAFMDSARIDRIIVVVHSDDAQHLDGRTDTETVIGGATRAASVNAGLDALALAPPDFVLIHDAARVCVSQDTINAVIDALEHSDGAAPGLAVTDALWRENGTTVEKIEPRANLYRAQTPQGFHFQAIHEAHQNGTSEAADDVELAIASGISVAITKGDEDNLKITTPADFERAERILKERS